MEISLQIHSWLRHFIKDLEPRIRFLCTMLSTNGFPIAPVFYRNDVTLSACQDNSVNEVGEVGKTR